MNPSQFTPFGSYGWDNLAGAPRVQTLALSWIGRTTGAYGSGTGGFGYPWKRLYLSPDSYTFVDPDQLWEGEYAYHPAGDTTIPTGTLCMMYVEGGSRAGYILVPVTDPAVYSFGCGLDVTAGVVSVDAAALAGDGLTTQVIGDCTGLAVNPGCGLEIDGGGAVAVNSADLVGVAATTSMVASGTCAVAFDKTITSTVVVTHQTDTTVTPNYCTGVLAIAKTLVVVTDEYNAAGVLVSTDYGAPATTTTNVDLCLMVECCAAEELTVVATADPTSGDAPLEVDFTATPSGGVAPYTYAWNFGDGGTSTAQNPTHTYTSCDEFEAVVVVTDACGCTATDSVVITVTCIEGGAECPGTAIGGEGEYVTVVTEDVDNWFDMGVLATDTTYSVEITTDVALSVTVTEECNPLTTDEAPVGTSCFEFTTTETPGNGYEINFFATSTANVTFTITAGTCP